ncbi:YihY/virulence factor BrkB family protein [Pseudoxanthomonas wuyuanensis]|uniref:Membrane protein n=1 Tax=Pseudoxanthomonas wuyuanensis TaxID=1073196 RepID=A0A286D9Y6_9GAMM|nr:YihY/virulence factor BrkB family protein [Pseudoxanthomonas wuyuanensis]KAF1720488.1 YihY/virulence factor BrkB family protein [Pseudoxanthomonas wuyuanensis]SOD55460.1 membrane protein [Pseudoxanthomonas wuyuanensis]
MLRRLSPARLRRQLQRLQQSLPVALAQRFAETDLMTQAAALAFYALLSLAPLLLLLLWLTASLYPPAQEALILQIGDLAGEGARTVAATIIANARDRPGVGSIAGLWSTLLLFVGATVVFARLQAALNLIFRTDAQRLAGAAAWLRKRIFSFGVVFALGFLLLVSMTLSTALQVMFARVPSLLPVLGNAVSLAIYVFAFALLYHYLPDRRVQWRQAFLGGAITAALFVAGRWLIGLYLSEAAPGSAYGSMGTLVILLLWIYYATLVFFAGALLTAVIDERVQARLRLRQAGIHQVLAPADAPDR